MNQKETSNGRLRHQGGGGEGLTAFESLISGAIAGTVSVICTYPLDLTRAQLAVMKRKQEQPNTNFLQLMTQNYMEKVSIICAFGAIHGKNSSFLNNSSFHVHT